MYLLDLQHRVLDYAHHFTLYDILAYGWVGVMFVFIVIIALMQVNKRPMLAIIMILFALILLFISPIAIKIFFDKTFKKVELIEQKVDRLNYSGMLVLSGKIKNSSKVVFKKCRIFSMVIKDNVEDNNTTLNKLKIYKNNLKPIRKMSILLDKRLDINKTLPYKMVYKDFNLSIKYDTKLYGECY